MVRKIFILLLVAYLLYPLFDKNLYARSELEMIEVSNRTRFYSTEMGSFYTSNPLMRVYLNRVFPFANKYLYKLAHP
ncbi:MAG: hypothetical protein UV71_C0011G0004 [Microgenomates group bacterium GW2011_GWC1_43_13]|uniref:Uncharacterized protein n=1 Tax=Candidatus Vogelbacteria bacterium RIFOXYD1_FULL_42_15 TaxID=1802437 RepID=A0A1G2QKN0_9BACT|nr:MAG: hypothetical protein UV71_C0011G0004 [Microgenomates group bacterium GW2011_GWC1_43_13]OGM76641.1 MAG: hypothetical protein A2208_00230 [Candidatus Woesebacteria bacterium RIFOXYA1_FULL_43_16]OHA60649.1 MAG: hypothetical protein A2607_01870 [Candidatus Vogelbacteria bacterium RIFOXYD1_FULL_42_15]